MCVQPAQWLSHTLSSAHHEEPTYNTQKNPSSAMQFAKCNFAVHCSRLTPAADSSPNEKTQRGQRDDASLMLDRRCIRAASKSESSPVTPAEQPKLLKEVKDLPHTELNSAEDPLPNLEEAGRSGRLILRHELPRLLLHQRVRLLLLAIAPVVRIDTPPICSDRKAAFVQLPFLPERAPPRRANQPEQSFGASDPHEAVGERTHPAARALREAPRRAVRLHVAAERVELSVSGLLRALQVCVVVDDAEGGAGQRHVDRALERALAVEEQPHVGEEGDRQAEPQVEPPLLPA
eukprot:CAMPEP_0182811710 /NCGR_PEP_ID=MMETSP0006_2-20121128/8417_1 /TAXON_ID=97485 /ORGANISM="Prymnesium parvum, Strain Texoma1" /LENGTH=290 /DNA_ID=CAMNT_0024937689 /DNA_START=96 /DNA_END=967 /DNA_ORIENTATION=+